jgi:hypothetical protein
MTEYDCSTCGQDLRLGPNARDDLRTLRDALKRAARSLHSGPLPHGSVGECEGCRAERVLKETSPSQGAP